MIQDKHTDPLFVALTKRPHIGGVPYELGVVATGLCVLGLIWTDQAQIFGPLWIALVGIAHALHAKDEDLIAIWVVKIRIFFKAWSINNFYWKGQSYDP